MLTPESPVFLALIGVIALAYSAVGHGGATGYLALMAFSTVAAKDASSMALVLNVFVATISFIAFKRARSFRWGLAWPFVLGSAPFAFLGGKLKLGEGAHESVLAIVLALSAIWLLVRFKFEETELVDPSRPLSIGTGAGIGLVSGMVGIGGGVFLSPVLLFRRWADAKQTASVSAFFILVNSLSGLVARPPSSLDFVMGNWPLVAVGITGALVGSFIGSKRLANVGLQRMLAVVLLAASVKLLAG